MLSFYTIATLCMLCDSLHPKTIVLENIYIRPRAKLRLNISPTRAIKSNILIPNYTICHFYNPLNGKLINWDALKSCWGSTGGKNIVWSRGEVCGDWRSSGWCNCGCITILLLQRSRNRLTAYTTWWSHTWLEQSNLGMKSIRYELHQWQPGKQTVRKQPRPSPTL